MKNEESRHVPLRNVTERPSAPRLHSRPMKRIFIALIVLAASFAAAQEGPLTALPYTPSLDMPSMDKTADPCADFYQYSCGGWMAHNPIPPDQAAWSVYGKLTNENARFLWGILDEASKPDPHRTVVQQKIGDYFAACMNEPAIETLGSKPLKPLLAQIAAIKSKKELAAFLAKEQPRTYGSGWFFGFGADQDFGDATQVIAFTRAGGLGLPDRDYYTKNDERSKGIREKYLAHVAKMLSFIQYPESADADAKRAMRIETDLAKA